MTLQTRTPSGRAGWPKILVEGGDKAGKSWSLGQLSASPKVGRTVVLALGEDETRWDEYGKIPGARFEIALHDGTWSSILAAVEGAKEEAAKARDAGEPPFVFGIDTMTAVWEGLKDWASHRARNSKKNRALLAADPDAEIDVTANFWNDARARHRILMRHLLTFPGIVVLIARGSEVALFQDGKPVLGQKTWSIEGERNLAYDVSVHVRLSRDARPLLVSASGVHCQIRPGIDRPRRLPDDWSLESVIFDTLKLDAANTEVREFTEFKQDMTPEQVRDEVLNPETGFERIKELYAFTERNFPAVEVENEPLLATLKRAGDQRRGARSPQPAATAEVARLPKNASEPEGADKAGPQDSWLKGALEQAPKHATLDACTVVWRKSAEMVKSSELAKDDAAKLQALLRKRMEELKPAPAEPAAEEQAQAEPIEGVIVPDLGDDWRDKIADIQGGADGDAVIEEATRLLNAEVLDPDHFAVISDAVTERLTEIAREQGALV